MVVETRSNPREIDLFSYKYQIQKKGGGLNPQESNK